MPKRWIYVLVSLVATSIVVSSCQREYSSDDVLPTSYSPSIIVGSNNQVLYGLHPVTGEKNWELGLTTPIYASPIVYNGSVYVAAQNADVVFKIDGRTGEKTQDIYYTGGGAGARATPIADEGLLYIASMNGTIYAIDTSNLTVKWSYATNGPIESSPTIHNGNIYVTTIMGGVYCFEKTNGTTATLPAPASPTWTLNLPNASFVSSPAVAEPYMFVGSQSDSNMYCIYLDAPGGGSVGAVRWVYKTQGPIKSSPAAYAGTCIFGSNDFHLYCLDTSLDIGITVPEARWIDSMNSEIVSSPYAYNQVVYVGCKDNRVYALKIINGAPKWTFSTNGIITASPLAYKGKIYIGSHDKYLYALDTARGTPIWKSNINGQIECSAVADDLNTLNGHNSQISGLTN